MAHGSWYPWDTPSRQPRRHVDRTESNAIAQQRAVQEALAAFVEPDTSFGLEDGQRIVAQYASSAVFLCELLKELHKKKAGEEVIHSIADRIARDWLSPHSGSLALILHTRLGRNTELINYLEAAVARCYRGQGKRATLQAMSNYLQEPEAVKAYGNYPLRR